MKTLSKSDNLLEKMEIKKLIKRAIRKTCIEHFDAMPKY
jgi:hypothetical protein